VTKSLDIRSVDFAKCEIASESGPSDPEMIRTVDHSPYRSIGDRDFEMPKSLDIKNSEIAICDFPI
jgi:hypothetical protein